MVDNANNERLLDKNRCYTKYNPNCVIGNTEIVMLLFQVPKNYSI